MIKLLVCITDCTCGSKKGDVLHSLIMEWVAAKTWYKRVKFLMQHKEYHTHSFDFLEADLTFWISKQNNTQGSMRRGNLHMRHVSNPKEHMQA